MSAGAPAGFLSQMAEKTGRSALSLGPNRGGVNGKEARCGQTHLHCLMRAWIGRVK
jgi:hypothetical protein